MLYRTKFFFMLFCLAMLFITPLAIAQSDYPTKPITVVLPYPSGSIFVVMDVVDEKMGQILGKPLVTSSKPGGGSAVGTVYVANSKPDGYTLLVSTGAFVSLPLTMANPPYKVSDFTPIGRMTTGDFLLVVSKSIPVNNLKEFIAYARKNTGKLSFTAGSAGSLPRLGAELLKERAGFDAQYIPYSGPDKAIPALLGGHVHYGLVEARPNIDYIRSGDLKALAIFSNKRDTTYFPNVPTLVEEGYPDVVTYTFFVLYAPAKTPTPIIKKLEGALKETLQDKDVREKLNKADFRIDFLNSEETKAFIDGDVTKWSEVIKKMKIEF
jgi:tripartite-type tricarboxylate transporter receptor subunit TctC